MLKYTMEQNIQTVICELKIGNDIIPFETMEFNNDLLTDKDKVIRRVYDVLTNNPVMIDISSLDYVPENDSTWDGENFSGYKTARKIQSEIAINGYKIAFLVDGKYKFFRILDKNTDRGKMMYAALLSSPEFLFR